MVPSFFVWSGSRLLGFELATPQRVIVAFHLWNGLMLVLGASTRLRLAAMARARRPDRHWAHGGGCRLPFPKLVSHEAACVCGRADRHDHPRLGIAVAWAPVERRTFVLTLAAVLGAFAWNTVLPLCLALVLLPGAAATAPDRSRMPAALALPVVMLTGAVGFAGFHAPFPCGPEISTALLPICLPLDYMFA